MAEFWVRHSLNPNKAVKFNITLRYFVAASEEGDHVWVLEVGTTYPDANGDPISAKKAHLISAEDFDEVVEDAVSELCAQIDWSPFVADKYAPNVSDISPTGSDVNIFSDVNFTINDKLPSAGIDISNMKVILNNSMTGFDITSEVQVEGDPYQYTFRWATPLRVFSKYE
jgi:hypothetical protein